MELQTNNNTLIGSAFDAMRQPLGMYEMREFIRRYGDNWWSEGVHGHLFEDQRRDVAPITSTNDTECIDSVDILLMLRLVVQSWKDVFRNVMDRKSQSWARMIIDARNDWAHATGAGISDEDAEDYLRTMARFMEQIDPETATAIRGYCRTIMARNQVVVVEEPKEPERTGIAVELPVTTGSNVLRPWQSVVAPKDDVAKGRFKKAEFALDLALVAKGDAGDEYQDPVEFFSRTYITAGMRSLLKTSLNRVSVTDDDAGDPVVELKTAFGGGKTHSMLAVYHLMRNAKIARELPGIAEVMDEARVPSLPDKVYVATLVGTDLNPATFKNPGFINGKVNTLWGEMAYQLCLQKGEPEHYEIIRAADSKSVAPGTDTLVRFFDAIGPCVVLMDEFVVYARNLYGNDAKNLPAGNFANVLSFVQQLTEAVKRTENCMLIASLPASARELGDEGGEEALKRVEHVFGRLSTIWRAADNEEGFEIVKRRLFKDFDQRLAEPVVDAFISYYKSDPDKFPLECRDHGYRDRMLHCYPVHPQVFDRLYLDWSTLESFQRTRGVLKIMATIIHNLWAANDTDPLIMPGSIDFSDAAVSQDFIDYLDPAWNAVVDSDVDGSSSAPVAIDRNRIIYRNAHAAQRVARTIFLGSAPSGRGESLRGLETSDIHLGAAIPGTDVVVYDDVLGKMRDELSYLYTTGSHYWYDTHPTLEKMARDRANRVEPVSIDARVVSIVRIAERSTASGFSNVYVCPSTSAEIPDDATLSLVILDPVHTVGKDVAGSSARVFAEDCVSMRGDVMRQNRNMLLFAAANATELRDARDAVRRELAWDSINEDAEALELTRAARSDAKRKLTSAQERAKRLVLGAYRHLLCPSQTASNLRAIEWESFTLGGSEGVSKRAYDKAREEHAIVDVYSPLLLNRDLDVLLWNGRSHIATAELADDYNRYLYLRRFANAGVLRSCIEQGVKSGDYFAYADGWDDGKSRFMGLKLKEPAIVDMVSGIVVEGNTALRQKAFDNDEEKPGGERPGGGAVKPGVDDVEDPPVMPAPDDPPVVVPQKREVQLEAVLDRLTAGMQVGGIVEEMLQPLYDLGATEVDLVFSASVTVPDGIDDGTKRALDENASVLKSMYGVTVTVR